MGLAPLAALSLAACASPSAEYPSLAIRDAERLNGTFTPAKPETEAPSASLPPAADTIERLAQLQAAAGSAHKGFLALMPRATQLVEAARESGVGSDRWAAAQVAISELDAQRSLTAIPMADLDRLYASRAVLLLPRRSIAEAQSAVQALIEAEDRVLANLKGALAQ